jgi:hypothetical protein
VHEVQLSLAIGHVAQLFSHSSHFLSSEFIKNPVGQSWNKKKKYLSKKKKENKLNKSKIVNKIVNLK